MLQHHQAERGATDFRIDVGRFTDDNRINPAVVLIRKIAFSFMMQTTTTLLTKLLAIIINQARGILFLGVESN